MAARLIDTDIIYSESFVAYLSNCDRRIRSGIRTTLDALSIPLPEAARAIPPGPKPGKAIAAAYAADAAIHRDNAYTASGNRRIAPDGILPPSHFNRA